MNAIVNDVKAFKGKYLPDFTWLELVDCIMVFLWYNIIGFLNFLKVFGSEYPEYNVMTGRFRTGVIHFTAIYLLQLFYIEEVKLQLEVVVSPNEGKIQLNVLSFYLLLNLPTSCLDYWVGGEKIKGVQQNVSERQKGSILNKILQFLVSLQYKVLIKTATFSFNDDIQLLIEDTDISIDLKGHSYAAQIGNLNLRSINHEEKTPSPLDVVSVAGARISIGRANEQFKIQVSTSKIATQIEETSVLIIIRYLLYWKSMSYYKVEYLRDYLDYRFEQLLSRLEYINSQARNISLRSTETEIQEDLIEFVRDYPNIDFHHSFYFISNPYYDNSVITQNAKRINNINISIDEILIVIHSKPNAQIHDERLRFTGILFAFDIEATPGEETVKIMVNNVTTTNNVDHSAVLPLSEPIISLNFHSRVINHTSFRGNVLPLQLRLNSKTINLLLWSINELTSTLNLNSNLIHSLPKDRFSLATDLVWEEVLFTAEKLTIEIWQDEKVNATNYSLQEVVGIQLNLLELTSASLGHPNCLQLSVNDVIIGPMRQQFHSNAFHIHPSLLLLNIKTFIPFNQRKDGAGVIKIIPISNFNNFQEWDAFITSFVRSNPNGGAQVKAISCAVQQCQVYCTNSDLKALSILGTALNQHSTLKTVTVDREFDVFTATVLDLSKIEFIMESVDVELEHQEEDKIHVYRVLHHQTITYESEFVTNNYWSSSSFCISQPLQVLYSLRKFHDDELTIVVADRVLLNITTGKPISFEERPSLKEGKFGEENESLASESVFLEDDEDAPPLTFYMKTGLSQVYWHVHHRVGFGAKCSSLYTTMKDVSLCVDIQELAPLFRCINHYSGNIYRVPYKRHEDQRNNTEQNIHFAITSKIFHLLPSSVAHYTIQRFRITLLHLLKPVMILQTLTLQYSTVAFGPHLSQSSFECTSLQVAETSGDTVKHKLIIDNMSGDLKNKLSYHQTSRTGEYGVMEFNADQLLVLYVHRAWMTLVTFLRDLFISDLYKAIYSHWPGPNPLPIYTHPELPKGLYRCSIMIRRSECHLPISSFAPDGLAIIFHHLNFYCTNEYLSKYPSYLSYSMGPYLAKRIWLSEMNNIKQFTSQIFASSYENVDMFDITDPELECRWKLAIIAFQDELTCKLSQEEDIKYCQTAEWYMTVELYDATIASWCNKNAVCNGQDISCTIRNRPATPNSDDPTETINEEIYHTATEEYRNTCIVDVLAEEIYWVLSQGQYWCIVNLIQQNFIEEYYHVQDPYIYPKWKVADVHEEIFGRDALNKDLPLISTVPVHILRGRIICIDNDSDFYETFVMEIPEGEILELKDCHNFDLFFSSSVPSYSNHYHHRESCWSKWSMMNKRHAPTSGISAATPGDKLFGTNRDRDVKIDHDTDAPFCVLIEQLELDFYRLQFGGGSGIEVSATTFIVIAKAEDVKPEDVSGRQNAHHAGGDDGDENASQLSENDYDDYDVKQILVAPRDFLSRRPHLLWSEKKTSAAASSFGPGGSTSTKGISKSPYHQYLSGQQKSSGLSKSPLRKPQPERKPHIRYSQQSVDNMRTCLIYLDDTIVVSHFVTAMAIVDFFHTPIRVNDQRNIRLVEDLGKGRNDWKTNMDVEVHVKRSILGLPNIPATTNSANTSMNSSAQPDLHSPHMSSANNLCFELNLDYLHGWRGFLESGPGSATMTLDTTVYATFIAPINELPTDRSCKMFDPVKIHFSNELKVLPETQFFERNYNLLKKWIHFGDWIHNVNKFPQRSSGSRHMKLTIDLVEEEELDELLNDGKRRKLSTIEEVVESEAEEDEEYEVDHDGNRIRKASMSSKPTVEDNESQASERKPQHSDDNPMRRVTRLRRDTQNSISEKPKIKRVTRGELSLKDIEFIISAITCFKGNMHRRVLRVPDKDPYDEISSNLSDIRYMPDLTYYLVYVDLPSGFKVDVKEFFSEFSDFEFMIRNNTYNLKLAKLHLSGIDANYCRHPQNLHIASQVKLSAWTFNDTIDEWEPLIEPIYMLAVALTDSTRGKSASLSSTSKIQVKVDTEALELNASQVALDNLIRKVRLNDVVTTSSKRLPPYKVVNELGIDLSFCIGYNGAIVIRDEIKAGDTCPIEVSQLSEKLEDYRSRTAYSDRLESSMIASMNQSIGTKEYLLWLSFPNFRDYYNSRVPLPIDRVGVTPFEMTVMNESELQFRKRQGSVFVNEGGETTLSTNLAPANEGGTTSFPTFLSQSHPGLKFVKELPLTLLDMKIKEDGVRELRLKSILSFRNITHRLLHLSLRLYGSSIEMSVAPGKEWNIPVRFANPKTALFLRADARTPWLEAAAAIGNFITAGYWGDPLRLKADVLSCPTESNDPNENWTVLLRPDVKNVKNTASAVSRQSALPIRYPTRETHRLRNHHNQGPVHSTEFSELGDDATVISAMSTSTTSVTSSTSSNLKTKAGGVIRPLCIHLQPPLQLLNLLPQPILYRLADGNGYLFASGMISPGQLVDVHNLPQLFISKLFISVRIVNYTWSKWTMLLSRTNPYLSNEKHTDLSLSSLLFNNDDKDFHLPSLEVSMTLKEYLVRFSCQYVLSNCTGQPLLFADPSNYELNLPITSNISINKYVEGNVNTYNNAQGAGVINYRLRNERAYINLNFNDLNDDDDDTESSLYEDSSQAASDPYLVSESSHEGSSLNLKADNSTGNSQEPIFGLTVYLPIDHCRKVNIVAAGSWTLAELFTQIKHSFSSLPIHAQLKDYIFFPYQISGNKNLNIKAEVQELNNLVEDEVSELGESAGSAKVKGKEKVIEKEKEKDFQPTYSDQQDIPSAMRFDMAVDLRVEALLPSVSVASAPNVLILCHKTEYQIFEQSSMIQTIALEREGRFFKSMFNKTKYIHRANFIKIEGDFPFRPKKMLGFNPVVSLCIPQQTEWSAGIDFIKSDLDRGELTIRVASSTQNASSSERRMSVSREISATPASPVPSSGEEKLLSVFEFGAFVEKGRGIFHNTTIVTFVPKHIFYSRLPLDLEIRLIEDDRATSSIVLAANTSVNFHFPQRGINNEANIKTFQVRQIDIANNKEPLSDWIGEFDITVLGIFYAKVVTESMTMILKVETELVGASFITTFREQNIQWPPYRIDNMTDYKLKFRQSMTEGPVIPSNAAPNDRVAERRPSYDPYAIFNDDSANRILGTKVSKETKWDEVQPGSSASYCWDYPLTGFKLLQIEVMEGIQTARGLVSLDDDSKIETLTLVKSVPNIGNPLAADELLMNAMDGTDTSTILGMSTAGVTSANSQWLETYCIVRPDVIYVYRKARDSLVKVINLSIPTGYSLVSRDEEEEINSVSNTLPKFAIVSKYVDKGWDIMGTVSSTVGFIGSMIGGNKAGIAAAGNMNPAESSSTGGISFDLNGVRRTILLLADQMKLFATCTPETFNISRQTRTISDEEATGSTPPPVPDESQIRYQNRRRSIMQRSARSNEPNPVPTVHDLRSLLQAKISVDQLLDEVCNFPIRLPDFLTAVKELKFVDSDEKAIDLFVQMFSAGYISTIEGGNTILGGASSGYFARETPDSPDSLEASRDNSKQDAVELAEGESAVLNKSNQTIRSIAAGSSGRESVTSSPGIFGNITDENYFDDKFEDRNKDVRRYSSAVDTIPGLTTSSRRPPLSRTVTNTLGFGPNSNPNGPAQMNASLKRKLPALLESLENVDLFFNAPSIVAEFVENMNQAAIFEMNPESNPLEAYGVTIYLNPTQKYHFKCSTYLAYCGWIQACRNAIEQTFVDYIVNRTNPLKRKEKLLSIEEYQVNVVMKVRADGSTKVLEILEGELEPAKINRSFASSLSSLIRGKKSSTNNAAVITRKRKYARAAILMPFLSGNQSLMIKHRSTSTRALNAPVTEMDENATIPSSPADDVEQELINVSFHVNSVSLSVVDATPYEILYLRLDNINMKVLRFVDSVKFTAAVEQIDISNQLLSPSFPVALFGRKRNKDAAASQRKFNLPGFQEMNYFATRNNNEFPALYLHLHQRYYKDSSMLQNVSSSSANTMKKDKSGKSSNSNSKGPVSVKSDIKLWYFETFTLWLTPLQLALEEEFVVRLFRYLNGLRSAFVVSNDTKRSRKLKEDDVYLTSSSGGGVSALTSGSTNSSTSSTSGGGNSATGANVHPHQHQSSRMVELDAYTVYDIYSHFIDSGRKPYQQFKNLVKSSLHLYFNTLQLHPLDIAFYFRPSPGIQISNAELALLSVISQLESSRLCLNALFAQHAYGSSSLMTEILVKHYRNSFWRQFHRLLSGVDPVDNTVCLVANVGGGVYDLSYESMDSVMEGEGILTTSNKGGVSSLASKALVGTSAITSKIAGGLGKGVSLLTLDMEFQRTRGYRRYVKASTVSEGLIVGTQELGKNIVEGVTGVVVAPMKGWETGGGVGFGVGVAKGVLGFALKPAVGVFDLASRATEGLRNTASTNADGGIVSQLQTVHRTRIPRAFGQLGLMVVYDAHAAAAQYMTDSLTGFKYETRLSVLAHLFHKRKLPRQQHQRRTSFQHHAAVSAVLAQSRPLSLGYHLPVKSPVIAAEFAARPTEVWGMQINAFYLTIVCPDRVALIQLSGEKNYDDDVNSSRFSRRKRRTSNANPSSASTLARHRKLSRKWIWSCPANCIDQLCSDSNGDLMIITNQHVSLNPTTASWQAQNNLNNQQQASIIDLDMQNYFVFQSLLEQSLGITLARQHPLLPLNQGICQGNIRKRYVSGLRSYIMSPTTHVYRIFGHVLYEYTRKSKKKSNSKAEEDGDISGGSTHAKENDTHRRYNHDESNSEEYAEHLIYQLFPTHPKDRDSSSDEEERERRGEEDKKLIEGKEEKDEEADDTDNRSSDGRNNRLISTELLEQLNKDLGKEKLSEEDTRSQVSSSTLDYGRPAEAGVPEDLDRDLYASSKGVLSNVNDDSNSDIGDRKMSHLPSSGFSSPMLSPDARNRRISVPASTNKSTALTEEITEEILERDYYLSFVYPLADLFLTGPNSEENGKVFSISLSKSNAINPNNISLNNSSTTSTNSSMNNASNASKMRVIKREDENEQFVEYFKSGLSLLFHDQETAKFWRTALTDRILSIQTIATSTHPPMTIDPNDFVPFGPVKPDDRSNFYPKLGLSRSNTLNETGAIPSGVNISSSHHYHHHSTEGSILSMLIIPTAAGKEEETERIKIEIARIKRV